MKRRCLAVIVALSAGALSCSEQSDDAQTAGASPGGQVSARHEDGAESRMGRRERLRRELLATYDMRNPLIVVDDLLAPGVAKDGIPALVMPQRTSAGGAAYPEADDRVVEVRLGGESVAYPLKILDYHEIANDVVGEVPIAVTYCPLCDSVAVFDRRLVDGRVLEFGVSGFLYNSNVMMYDRTDLALWSQVKMQAVTGPNAGRGLRHLPFRVVTFAEYLATNKGGQVLTTNTGYERDYDTSPYVSYLHSNRMYHEFETDHQLQAHTLGLGIVAGDRSWFVIASAAAEAPITVETEAGPVVVEADAAGVRIAGLPDGVRALQTFYHSWAAFHPGTTIVPSPPQ